MPWEDENGNRLWKDVVSYMGMNSYTRKWETLYAYGGKWAENITQAVARDMMAEAMVRLEGAGYSVVLTVHDEIVSEVDQDFGSLREFKQIMVQLPAWAMGCPVAAGGWEGSRYRK
jgi:DNA polymerase